MKGKRILSLALTAALLLATAPYWPAAQAAAGPQVFAGGKHTLVLRADGTLWAAGSNTTGQLGLGHVNPTDFPQKVDLANVVSAAAGDMHSLAVTSDGTLYAWGSNKEGQLGLNSWQEFFAAPRSVMTGVKAVSAGTGFSLIIKSDGAVWACGKSDSGSFQLGTGTSYQRNSHEFVQVKLPAEKFAQIAAGPSYALALSESGALYAWGNNAKGTLGVEKWDSESRHTPVAVAAGKKVVAIAAGASFSFYIDDKGQLYGSGSSYLGNDLAADRLADELIGGMSNCRSVSAGPDHVLAVKNDGTLWAWGDNADGQLGLGNYDLRRAPVQLGGVSGAQSVSTGDRHTLFITADGKFWGTGYNGSGRLCNASTVNFHTPTEVMRVTDMTPKAGLPNAAGGQITRKEMAYLLMDLYKKLTGKTLGEAETTFHIASHFYEDAKIAGQGTADFTILRAFELGIMNQASWRQFKPDQAVPQAEMYDLFLNMCERAGVTVTKAQLPAVSAAAYATKEQAEVIGNFISASAGSMKYGADGVGAPVFKWGYAGTNNIWSYEWLYSAPAVADFGNGPKIISSGFNTVCVDAVTGKVEWRILNGYDVTHPVKPIDANFESDLATWDDVVIADIDGDGKLEIIIAHQKGRISVLDQNGKFKPGWENKTLVGMDGVSASDPPRLVSMCVADLDGDGKMEIVLGLSGDGRSKNVYVLNHDGKLRSGWPQKNPLSPGPLQYVTGIFGNTISVGDMTVDGRTQKVIAVPCDTRTVALYRHDGTEIKASSIYGDRVWSEIPFWYDYEYEKTAEARIALDMNNRPTGDDPMYMRQAVSNPYTGTAIADLDGDGVNEIVMLPNVFDYALGTPPSLFVAPMILNADRTRYNKNGHNWEVLPKTGPPTSTAAEQLTLMLRPNSVPTIADLDGDGKKEIVFSAFDGKVHAYWLDKTQHGSWPISVQDPSSRILEFAGAPAVYDFNKDGKQEVVFTTYVEREATTVGYLYIASHDGRILHKTPLPFPLSASASNGALARPVIQEIGGKAMIFINTLNSGLCAYEVPLNAASNPAGPTAPVTPANPIDSADTWAREGIQAAIAKGFVPDALQNNYKDNVTRAEFVLLAMSWLRFKTGLTTDQLVAQYAVVPDRTFSDTTNTDILAAGKLDITAGAGGGLFGVGDTFSREQAAVMLTKVHIILGEGVDNAPPFGFTDIGAASGWAQNAINYVGAHGVMGGTSTTEKVFSPKQSFTRQQSIVTFNNIQP